VNKTEANLLSPVKRALITGLGGFVASHLAEYLLANTDWEIVGTMRWNDSLDNLRELTNRINRKDRISIVYADLNDSGSMRSVMKDVDYVFHLAAQSYPKTSFDIPIETLQTNVIGTANLLEAVKHESPKAWVHVCSSSEVYGRVPMEFVPIKENCRFHPASPYAISKAGTDMLGQFYAQAYGLNVIVTRMFTHTGPRRGDVFSESTFAKQIAMIEAEMIPPVIKVGNLNSLRTIADVRDAVRAYHTALTVNPCKGEVYNIGGSHTCTVGIVLEALFSAAGRRYDIEVDPERVRPIDADLQVPDSSKFKAHTGWEPKIPFEQTMADLLHYWRKRVRTSVALQR
jgi:GDP-mannose 4,6-dehydratase